MGAGLVSVFLVNGWGWMEGPCLPHLTSPLECLLQEDLAELRSV